MPYIRTIPPAEATGKLKEIYESGAGPSGGARKSFDDPAGAKPQS
jgi:hypothetical protein